MAIFMAALGLVARSVARRNVRWVIGSTFAVLAILVAALSGVFLVPSQKDGLSFSMALVFLVAYLIAFEASTTRRGVLPEEATRQ